MQGDSVSEISDILEKKSRRTAGPREAISVREPPGELRSLVLAGLKSATEQLPASMRLIAGYHFGWTDENGQPVEGDPGKLIRPALTLLCAQAAGGQAEQALPTAVAIELVHNFSLLHDDVMDGDAIRRHRRTVWSLFGTADAILLGDALMVLAFKLATGPGHMNSMKLSPLLLDMLHGQKLDISFENRTDVTIGEGLAMAAGKTGALLGGACRLGALSAGADDTTCALFGKFGDNIGIAFQLVDDLLGIWGDPAITGKPVHSDLRARKKSLPVLAALASGTSAADRLASVYNRDSPQPFDSDECAELARLIEEAGGRAWAERRAQKAYASARVALARARPEPCAGAELLALADALVRRNR